MAIQQPYAELVVRGIKDVENRSSAMPEKLRGKWCAIYASKTLAPVGSWIDAMDLWHRSSVEMWPWPATEVDEFDRSHPWPHHEVQQARKQCTRGAIIGLVRWDQTYAPYCGLIPTTPWRNRSMHGWTYSFQIALSTPVPLERGCQSLYWYLDDDTVLALMASTAGSGQEIPLDVLKAWSASAC